LAWSQQSYSLKYMLIESMSHLNRPQLPTIVENHPRLIRLADFFSIVKELSNIQFANSLYICKSTHLKLWTIYSRSHQTFRYRYISSRSLLQFTAMIQFMPSGNQLVGHQKDETSLYCETNQARYAMSNQSNL